MNPGYFPVMPTGYPDALRLLRHLKEGPPWLRSEALRSEWARKGLAPHSVSG